MNTQNIHWSILDEKRKVLLPLMEDFSLDHFYLAGGTGLALQIGHRDSIDFDFFKEGEYDTAVLISKLENIFSSHKLLITQEEKNTVSCVINNTVQISFFGYNHKVIKDLIRTEYFNIASIEDIACMKLSAITSRSLEKDYVDLYFILKKLQLKEILDIMSAKYPSLDKNVILKSLVYFDDVLPEPLIFKEGHNVAFEDIKKYLRNIINNYFKTQ